MSDESYLRRKKRRRVYEMVFQFLLFAALWYGISFFVLDSRLWRIVIAIALSAWLTHALSTDEKIGKIQPGQQVRCPRCNTLGITIGSTGKGATCTRCRGKSTWAEIVADQRASTTDGV